MNEPPLTAEQGARFWPGVAAAAAVGLLLRAWGLNGVTLQVDEVYEVTHRTTDLFALAAREDSFPPLGRWLMAWWMAATGDRGARWFSVAAALLGMVATACLGRAVAGPRVGVLTAWLCALSAHHVYYSQLARPYSLYFAFGALAMCAGWRLRNDGRWRAWFWFAAASLATLATHYYGALLIAVLFALVVAGAPHATRRRALPAALAFAAACLPLLPCLLIDLGRPKLEHTSIEFDAEAYAYTYTYLTLVSGFTLGPPLYALRDMSAAEGVRAMAPWAVAVGAVVLALTLSALRLLGARRSLWLMALLIAPPLLAAAAATLSPTGYLHRYLGWVLTPLLVLLASGAARAAQRPWVAAASIGLVALSLYAVAARRLDSRYTVDDFRRVATILAADPAAPVLAVPRYFAMAPHYYLAGGRAVVAASLRPNDANDWREQLGELAAAVGDRGHYWIVTQHFPTDDARRSTRDRLVGRLDAEHVERVTWTIDVYRAPAATLRAEVARSRARPLWPPQGPPG